jgi:hypothetical protein
LLRGAGNLSFFDKIGKIQFFEKVDAFFGNLLLLLFFITFEIVNSIINLQITEASMCYLKRV